MSDYRDHVNAARWFLSALPPPNRMSHERIVAVAQVEALLALAAAVASQGPSSSAHHAAQAAAVVAQHQPPQPQ